MLTMQEARGKAYDIFPPQVEGDRRVRQINIVKYIDHLASTTRTTIDEWPVLDVFMNAETKLLYTERSKINELFFKFRDSVPEKPTKEEALTEAMAGHIKGICESMIKGAIELVTHDRNVCRLKVAEKAHGLMLVQREMAKTEATLRGLAGTEAQGYKDLGLQIREVVKGGFYSFHEVQNRDVIRLKTKPITLSYLSHQQEATNVVPMGWYVVEIRIQPRGILHVRVWPGGDNPKGSEKCAHPHVKGGDVCFGSTLSAYSQAAASFDFPLVAEVVKEVLTGYNDANPHVHLYQFEAQWRAKRFHSPAHFYPDIEMAPEVPRTDEGTENNE